MSWSTTDKISRITELAIVEYLQQQRSKYFLLGVRSGACCVMLGATLMVIFLTTKFIIVAR